ncbi:MBL fold metallo-hydrolase [Candidatus Woesearchaeota archaeon]|nr:MBL fold metallo-hydrolase [Candidatus Woesearchaeota archaeon]
MKLVFHGGASEVGRSCIEVDTGTRRLLLDCGLKLTPEGTEYPIGFTYVNNIDAVFISHAHLDHTGALPLLDHKGMNCPIFATKATKALTKILLRDAFKIGRITHQHLEYDEADIRKVLDWMQRVRVDEKGLYEGISYEFFDAGHIPGAASVFLEVEGTTFLYTGDINTSETRLHSAAETDFPNDIDVMICESTYGDREHPPRLKTEDEFLESVRSVIKRGGSVIVPVFAVGRSQEIIMVLKRGKFNVPIFFDGMGIDVTTVALDNPKSIKDPAALRSAFKGVRQLKKDKERLDAIKTKSIIVTTSGMLTGGPVLHYLKYLGGEPKHAVFLTGYQGDDTNGRLLLNNGYVFIDGNRKIIKAEVKQFDFSAHSGEKQLKDLVRKVRPKKVVFVHGDPPALQKMVEWAQALGMESVAPKLGDVIDI